jgi:hypothetical protein
MHVAVLIALLLAAAPAAAQPAKENLPLFAADVHAATVGLPQAEGWVPVVSANTELPGRNWGLGAGAMIYPIRLGVITFGVGASMLTGRGSGESLTITTGSGASASTEVTPVVHTAVTHLMPQIGINFGHKLGWSYVSAGVGRSKVTSSADAAGTTPGQIVPEAWNTAINFGGGAKWFMKPHLGASFDARWVKLSSRPANGTLPSTKRTQMWNISAGISIQ